MQSRIKYDAVCGMPAGGSGDLESQQLHSITVTQLVNRFQDCTVGMHTYMVTNYPHQQQHCIHGLL